jgi:hypothetical protein
VKEKTISMEDAKKEYVDYTNKIKVEADRALAMKTEYPDKDIKQLVSVYAKALGTDPVNAFRAMVTGEKLDKVEGNAVLLQRMRGAHYLNPGGSEEYIKERLKAMGISEKNRENYRLEHIVPVSAGGSNADSNLQIIDKDLHESYTSVDIALGKAVKEGKITRSRAAELSRGLKINKTLSRDEVLNAIK